LEIIKKYIAKLLEVEKFWLVTAFLSLLCSIVLFAFGYNVELPGYLDSSWQIALHEFFATNKQFGTEIVFTYGPYGFLSTRLYHPKTYWFTNLGWFFFSIVFWWFSFYIAYKLFKNKLIIIFWFVALLFLFTELTYIDSFFQCFSIFFLIYNFYIEDEISIFNETLLIFTLSLISLTKFSFFFMIFPIILLASLKYLVQKKIPYCLGIFTIFLIFFWVFAGQSLFNFPSYIKNSLEIAYFYNYTMSPIKLVSDISDKEDFFLWIGIFFVALIFFTLFINAWQKRRYISFFGMLGFLYLMFVTFKAGYGRFDFDHLVVSVRVFSIIATFFFVISIEEKKENYLKISSFIALLIISMLLQYSINLSLREDTIISIPDNCKSLLYNTKNFFSSENTRVILQVKYEKEMAKIRNLFPVEPLDGFVDANSHLQKVILANNLNYKPRPIFQGYAAFSPSLAKINAEYTNKAIADYVLFSNETIDYRYPTLDDSFSMLEYLTKYEVKSVSPSAQFLVLQRSQSPKDYSFVGEQQLEAAFNQEILVPKINQGAVWVKMDIGYSKLGNLYSKIYKPKAIYLEVTTVKDKKYGYYLPTPMAQTGFLLSPLIKDNLGFAKLFSEDWQKELNQLEIKSFKLIVSDKDSSWQFSPKFKIIFSYLDFPRKNTPNLTSALEMLTNDSPTTALANAALLSVDGRSSIDSISSFEELLESKSDSQPHIVYNNMGRLLLHLSLTDEAIEAFENSLKHSPDFPLAKANLDYARSINLEANLENNAEIIDKQTKASNYILLANYYSGKNKIEKSINLYEKASKLDPTNPSSYERLCSSYSQLGDFDKAIFACERFFNLTQDPLAKDSLEQAKLKKSKSQKSQRGISK
jgi:tetratricopeptide (TPR) repeat protein